MKLLNKDKIVNSIEITISNLTIYTLLSIILLCRALKKHVK